MEWQMSLTRKRQVPSGTKKGLLAYLGHLKDKAAGNRKHAEMHPNDGPELCLKRAAEYEDEAGWIERFYAEKLK
jgi:hypothetical protein